MVKTDDDKNWFTAEQDGRCGLVPANYIQLKPHRLVMSECVVYNLYVSLAVFNMLFSKISTLCF